jgi:hypothetical protein
MPYVHMSHTPGRGLADFRAVSEEITADRAPGHLAMIAGETDGALHVVDVWESKADADRFTAEQLFPALSRTGRGPGPDATYVAFETDDVSLVPVLP